MFDSGMLTTIEPTLVRLNQYVHQQIKWTDFTVEDKMNMMELFVTHETTLKSIHQVIFPKSTTFDK